MGYGNRVMQDDMWTRGDEMWFRQNRPGRTRRSKTSRTKRWLKQVASRIRRQQERRSPEDAPVKVRFYGYAR